MNKNDFAIYKFSFGKLRIEYEGNAITCLRKFDEEI